MLDACPITPVRERKLVRARTVAMQRVLAEVHMDIYDLPLVDQLIVLNEVLSEKLAVARAAGVLALQP